MAEITLEIRQLAMQMLSDFDTARERRAWAKEHLPGPEKADLMRSADRFDKAGISRAIELASLIRGARNG